MRRGGPIQPRRRLGQATTGRARAHLVLGHCARDQPELILGDIELECWHVRSAGVHQDCLENRARLGHDHLGDPAFVHPSRYQLGKGVRLGTKRAAVEAEADATVTQRVNVVRPQSGSCWEWDRGVERGEDSLRRDEKDVRLGRGVELVAEHDRGAERQVEHVLFETRSAVTSLREDEPSSETRFGSPTAAHSANSG